MSSEDSGIRSIADQDGGVILDIKRDQFFSLNIMGSRIWTDLQTQQSIDEIKATIVEETGADASTVASDVDEFIEELRAKGLLQGAAK
jgi:Coenzyme PQQ synthesis protein D (PqqD)